MRGVYDLDLVDLEGLIASWGEPPLLARQVWRGIYADCAARFDGIQGVPASLRARLSAEVAFYVPRLLDRQEAEGGETLKDLLEMEDGERVEVVLLRYRDRASVCVSTQVGCACGCLFCATGQAGFVRQLSSGEIVAQVIHAQRELAASGHGLSNIVLMGMGEPLLNYAETLSAIRRLADPRGLGFVHRRITLSTVGIAPEIERLAGEVAHRGAPLRIRLAVSLHAATDDLRDRLAPINRRYPLDRLFAAVRRYVAVTGRRVMFEWVLIDRLNDTREQAEALAARLAGLPAHVNLIQLNPTASCAGRPLTFETIDAFVTVLDRAHISHTMRQRRGSTIEAGCGQLRWR